MNGLEKRFDFQNTCLIHLTLQSLLTPCGHTARVSLRVQHVWLVNTEYSHTVCFMRHLALTSFTWSSPLAFVNFKDAWGDVEAILI